MLHEEEQIILRTNYTKNYTKNTRKEINDKVEKLTGCKVVHKVKYLGIDLTNKNIDF